MPPDGKLLVCDCAAVFLLVHFFGFLPLSVAAGGHLPGWWQAFILYVAGWFCSQPLEFLIPGGNKHTRKRTHTRRHMHTHTHTHTHAHAHTRTRAHTHAHTRAHTHTHTHTHANARTHTHTHTHTHTRKHTQAHTHTRQASQKEAKLARMLLSSWSFFPVWLLSVHAHTCPYSVIWNAPEMLNSQFPAETFLSQLPFHHPAEWNDDIRHLFPD